MDLMLLSRIVSGVEVMSLLYFLLASRSPVNRGFHILELKLFCRRTLCRIRNLVALDFERDSLLSFFLKCLNFSRSPFRCCTDRSTQKLALDFLYVYSIEQLS